MCLDIVTPPTVLVFLSFWNSGATTFTKVFDDAVAPMSDARRWPGLEAPNRTPRCEIKILRSEVKIDPSRKDMKPTGAFVLVLELRLLGRFIAGKFGQFRHENDSCSRSQYLDSGNFAMDYYSLANDDASDLCILTNNL
jgi:hypothetical protein